MVSEWPRKNFLKSAQREFDFLKSRQLIMYMQIIMQIIVHTAASLTNQRIGSRYAILTQIA